MQYYAQDTVASHRYYGAEMFNTSIVPEGYGSVSSMRSTPVHNSFYNDQSNFMWYNLLGNLGFISYGGVGSLDRAMSNMREACAYFGRTKPAFIFLLGHFNEHSNGMEDGMDVPTLRGALAAIPGCDIGDRLKFVDGHQHCNYVQTNGKKEPIGFMSGARGMVADFDSGCLPMIGFTYIDSSRDGKLRIWYFSEHTLTSSQYDEILGCVKSTRSLHACTHLATLWLETDLPQNRLKTEPFEVLE